MNEKVQNNNVYINGNVTPYANIEHLLREATRLTRKDNGVSEKLNPTDKMIYVEMRDKFFSYTSQGKEYYENHDQIAAAVGVGVATTYRSIKKWESLGLITRNQIRTKLGHLSNSYSVKSFSYEVENFFIEGVKGDISLPTSGLHGESQPAEKHGSDAVRPPPSTPERDRDMDLDIDDPDSWDEDSLPF